MSAQQETAAYVMPKAVLILEDIDGNGRIDVRLEFHPKMDSRSP